MKKKMLQYFNSLLYMALRYQDTAYETFYSISSMQNVVER
jgi:hypothetical protein